MCIIFKQEKYIFLLLWCRVRRKKKWPNNIFFFFFFLPSLAWLRRMRRRRRWVIWQDDGRGSKNQSERRLSELSLIYYRGEPNRGLGGSFFSLQASDSWEAVYSGLLSKFRQDTGLGLNQVEKLSF